MSANDHLLAIQEALIAADKAGRITPEQLSLGMAALVRLRGLLESPAPPEVSPQREGKA